jgi:hypothetical protein
MAKRKTRRLSPGEYASSNPSEDVAVMNARVLLCEAIERVLPELLKALRERVFPFYADLARQHHSPFTLRRVIESDEPIDDRAGKCLRESFRQWADQFKVPNWLRSEAIKALRLWRMNPQAHASLAWELPQVIRSVERADPFEMHLRGWDFELQPWAAYKEFARKKFEEQLSAYEISARAGALKAPKPKTSTEITATKEPSMADLRAMFPGQLADPAPAIPWKLKPVQRTFSPRNFEWFVLHELAGKSLLEISALDPDIDLTTLKKGIKTAARLLGS